MHRMEENELIIFLENGYSAEQLVFCFFRKVMISIFVSEKRAEVMITTPLQGKSCKPVKLFQSLFIGYSETFGAVL